MAEISTVPRPVRVASEWSLRLLLIGAALLALATIVRHLSEAVVPLFVALLLAALLWPVTRIMARRIPRGAAAGVTVLGTLGAIAGAFTIIGTQLSNSIEQLTNQVSEGLSQVRSWVLTTFHITDDQYASYFDHLKKQIQSSGNLTNTAAQAGSTATHVLAGLFITLFSLYFFLYEGERIWAWVVGLFPRVVRARVDSSGVIAWGQLSSFTKATVVVAATDALGISIGAAVLHVPLVLAIGLLVFIGAFVPVIGAALSGTVAVLLALVAQGPVYALIMLAVVIAVQQLESHVLQPFLLGRAVRVHPLSVILAIAVGVIVAGIVGALIAVPFAAVANAVGHHLLDDPGEPIPDAAESGALAGDPVPSPSEDDDAERATERVEAIEQELT
ncbi:MAG: AI-2E family transporter [Nostocoides sp.]